MHLTISRNKMFMVLATVKGPKGEMEANLMQNAAEKEEEIGISDLGILIITIW